jgi:hypothetical protein
MPVADSPVLQQRPVWREPAVSARYVAPPGNSAGQRGQIGWRLAVFIPLTLLFLALATQAAWLLLIPVVVGCALFLPMATAGGARSAQGNAQMIRQAEWAKYQQATTQWKADLGRHERAEEERRASAPVWYPLQVTSGARRIDVLGGTGDGWASLLTTLGSSVLAGGDGILLLDFSREEAGGGLAEVASEHGLGTRKLELPAALSSLDLLSGLNQEECAEVLADAVSTLRPAAAEADVRAMHAAFLGAVTGRLAGNVTFVRVSAGLRVLQRRYDGDVEPAPLTADEVRALTSYVDMAGATERAQAELGFLCDMLELLAYERDGEIQARMGEWWRAESVTVITTDDLNERRKDLMDRILVQVVLQHLRKRRLGDGRGVLMVAGTDHLGAMSLEALTRQARMSGTRLVLFFEHLRGDAVQLLGGSDSAAILMRLGNAQEAAAAAEFIGRSHRFVQSQLTRQVGETTTTSSGVSGGGQSGMATTIGQARGHNQGPGGGSRHFSSHMSVTDSRMHTWSETKNWSAAASVTHGETDQRVYEFAVEPTEIQALAPTAFILVESTRNGRRAVLGDCNPGIVTLDRVSAAPRDV